MRIISTNTIKDTVPFSGNVDDTLLSKMNESVEISLIKNLLGTDLYDRVITEINGVVSAPIQTLIDDYLVYVISWTVHYESIIHLQLRTKEQGIVNQTADTAVPSNIDDFKYLRNNVSRFRDEFNLITIKYLNDNLSLYPEFRSSDNCSEARYQYSDVLFFSNTSYKNNYRIDYDAWNDCENC